MSVHASFSPHTFQGSSGTCVIQKCLFGFYFKENGRDRSQVKFFLNTWLVQIKNSQNSFCVHINFSKLFPLCMYKLLITCYTSEDLKGPCWSFRTVPKTQTKSRALEEKGRRVFGVPLLVSSQQTGEPLPPCILRALLYLRTECLHQVTPPPEGNTHSAWWDTTGVPGKMNQY